MAFQQKKKYDIENQTLQTLSQKWSAKDASITDYACNMYADKIAIIDLYILQFEDKDPEFVTKLKALREQLKTLGRAKFIQRSDILTQLGIIVGKTGTRDFDGSFDAEPEL